jgi:uncharacterized protein with HEPN domain
MTLHDPIVSVHHMLDHAREAVGMVRGRSRADLDTDRQLNLSLVRLVEVIGEAANRVPDDFRSRHPQVLWRQTVGMRNRMVHGYDVIDFDILWSVLQKDLPPLIEALEKILKEEA